MTEIGELSQITYPKAMVVEDCFFMTYVMLLWKRGS